MWTPEHYGDVSSETESYFFFFPFSFFFFLVGGGGREGWAEREGVFVTLFVTATRFVTRETNRAKLEVLPGQQSVLKLMRLPRKIQSCTCCLKLVLEG